MGLLSAHLVSAGHHHVGGVVKALLDGVAGAGGHRRAAGAEQVIPLHPRHPVRGEQAVVLLHAQRLALPVVTAPVHG